jgi:hypothetical protein
MRENVLLMEDCIMRNILFWSTAVVFIFSAEPMKAMQRITVPTSTIFEFFSNEHFPDCQLQQFYRGMKNRQARHLFCVFW